MRVKDIMRKRPGPIMPETSIAEAMLLMHCYRVEGLSVAVNKELVGLVLLPDVLAMFFPEDAGGHKPEPGLDMRQLHNRHAPVARVAVKRVMRVDSTSVTADQTVKDAMDIMLNARVSGLPVTESGRLVGMIRLEDVNKAIPGITGTRAAA